MKSVTLLYPYLGVFALFGRRPFVPTLLENYEKLMSNTIASSQSLYTVVG